MSRQEVNRVYPKESCRRLHQGVLGGSRQEAQPGPPEDFDAERAPIRGNPYLGSIYQVPIDEHEVQAHP